MNIEEIHNSIIKNTVFKFSRSGGKGGQNVNKVNTKVQASIDLEKIQGLSNSELAQLKTKQKNRITNNQLCVNSTEERTQERNREIALRRLEQIILTSAKIFPQRKKTKPTLASKERRLLKKKLKSQIKSLRSEKF